MAVREALEAAPASTGREGREGAWGEVRELWGGSEGARERGSEGARELREGLGPREDLKGRKDGGSA